jgi:hypothetical protein
MVTQSSSESKPKVRITRSCGDSNLWNDARRSNFLKQVFTNSEKAFLDTLGWLLAFIKVTYGFCHTTTFRGIPGKRQSGIVLTIAGTSTLAAYNSTSIWEGWAGLFGIFIVPIKVIRSDWAEIYDFMFVDIHSIPLLCYTLVFTLRALYNTFMTYIGRSNKNDSGIRGESYLKKPLIKLFRLRKNFEIPELATTTLEAAIIIGLGVLAWKKFDDVHFAWVLFITVGVELIHQINDHTHQEHVDRVLDA